MSCGKLTLMNYIKLIRAQTYCHDEKDELVIQPNKLGALTSNLQQTS